MKKMLVLALVFAVASLANATAVIQFGNASGAFGPGNTIISTVAVGGTYDLYVWASSDAVVDFDPETFDPLITTGVDNIQLFAQFDTTKVNLTANSIGNLSAVSGNPFGTTWSGRAKGTFNSLGYAEGALIAAGQVDAFPMTKIMKLALTVSALGQSSTVSMLSPGGTHETKIGNAVNGQYGYGTSSVTFIPEPMTMTLLGLGGLLFVRRK